MLAHSTSVALEDVDFYTALEQPVAERARHRGQVRRLAAGARAAEPDRQRLRYSPRGSRLRIALGIADDASVEIAISGEVPGIASELRERIFETYVRLAGSSTEDMGRGLGLTVCRLAVEAHGGCISAEANEPQGCCFRIHLPRRQPA